MPTAMARGSAATTGPAARITPSPALEWVWNYLRDVPQPHILDCGSFRASTAKTLLRRGAKLYVADLVGPLLEGAPQLWDRSRKLPIFRTDAFLAQLPRIRAGSLSLVVCWQLLDLLPHDSLAAVVLQTHSYLQPGGVFFCILREPYLAAGADVVWRLETLTSLKKEREGTRPFPYKAITSREMERLLSTDNVKTFLTRSGFRETLAIK
jgi:hypothetical protein